MNRWSRDPLDTLSVIDSLEIGPTRMEPNRLITPYTVVRGAKSDRIDFKYRFEEDVFDHNSSRDLNLAGLMGAQVAINYGLFCKKIVFHDPLDDSDRKFLEEALRMTAQEIFVIKLLHPNMFIHGKAAHLEPVKKQSYLRARLVFIGKKPVRPEGVCNGNWNVSSQRLAVLSSGGKESLLSFGALRDAGWETHPIFVNESGRHWMTALNAYRHFRKHVPTTARVWTNSDRVFSWMLRQLPFVREDFAEKRSDAYPIRLWTVAVFVFGVLPLLRKREIGRLVVGDEYDTTTRATHHGIGHFNGLYDQSRHFDNYVTRYFQAKRWGVSQFSILRPLSELLVLKTLTERYPDLWRQQMSCHASHMGGDRALPCGKCEKCRRVVGMLLTIGAPPRNIGYNQSQIEDCLRTFEREKVHQEKACTQHTLYLLREKGLIKPGSVPHYRIKARPEVMRLRFDAERSLINAIPVDLRKPLYRVFLEHAEGASKRSGRLWQPMDLLNDNLLHRPYPFEKLSAKPAAISKIPAEPGDHILAKKREYVLGDLSWPEAKQRLRQVDVALLPVGSIEQHGPHLALDTDAFDAEYLSRRVAMACSVPLPLVLPLVPYGVSYSHEDFKGTIGVSPEALYSMVYDIGMSASRNGITKLVIINGHGGNAPALQFAAQAINRDAHIFTCVDTGETSDTDVLALTETPGDVHAGEVETSTNLATRPGLVKMHLARKSVPKMSIRYLDFSSKRSVEWYTHMAKISSNGVLGDPTKASREKGQRMWEVMIRNLVEFIEHLKNLSLDEIYQRRY